jgi:hypothetical protein
MFESLKNKYCPHCYAIIERDLGYRPKRCGFCNGLIAYTRGGTRKGFFEIPEFGY